MLQLVCPDWPADSIRKAGVSFSLVSCEGGGRLTGSRDEL